MRVNIGGVWYDPNDVPIQIELDNEDRVNISRMPKHIKNYICFPDSMDFTEASRILKMEISKKFNDGKEPEEQK